MLFRKWNKGLELMVYNNVKISQDIIDRFINGF